MRLSEFINEWTIDENVIILEPQEGFNGGIIGISEDKCHLIYSYQKLTEALATSYEREYNKNNPKEELSHEDFLNDACEWVDYNTIRQLPYMDEKYRPIIIYEFEDKVDGQNI